ncbi:MAG TPA: hypothetical protein ENK18_02715, partial [Deltaproteobacteria bacterium]|nr:hypothetical protein [Deltaproteobacteria bacterium]
MKHIMTDEGMVMVMQGVPGWMFALAVGLVITLTFVLVERAGLADTDRFRIDLTSRGPLRGLLRKRWFQPAIQLPILVLFLLTVVAGLFGSSGRNIAPVLVWTVWWAGLIFGVALAGNIWCAVCPWDALANLVSRAVPWRRGAVRSLGLPWPAWGSTVYPALILFVGVTWAELGWGITNDPRTTAVLGALMALGAMGMALLYDRKVFCRSVCLVGRTSGMYAMFAPFEIRPADTDACDVCQTRACLNGNNRGYACPTGLDLGQTNENTYCTLCTECFKSCKVPALRVRPFGRDLSRVKRWRTDEALLALTLLALTGFHGLSMTPVWENFEPGTTDLVGLIRQSLSISSLSAFTVGMAGVMALPFAAYAALTWVAWRWVRDATGASYRELLVGYAYAVLPVALFYHLAHNAMHLFMEGQEVIPLLSDPLGTGANWFGTAGWHPGPLLSMQSVWLLQVLLVVVGHVFGVIVSHRI